MEIEGAQNGDIGRAWVESLDPLRMTFPTIKIVSNGTLITAWAVVTGSTCPDPCIGYGGGGSEGGPILHGLTTSYTGDLVTIDAGDESDWVTIVGGEA